MKQYTIKILTQERRSVPRIPMGVGIYFPHIQTKVLCDNLSKTGCFFPSVNLGAVGETVLLAIDLPEIGIISVKARIIHKGEDGKGTGFQFIDINSEDEMNLTSFLDIFNA